MGNRSLVFAYNLRWLRKHAGVTQRELSEHIRLNGRKVSRCYVTQLESGRIDPRLSTIRSVAKYLRVKPWFLVADLTDNLDFWAGYLQLPPQGKRDIQRHIAYILERRGR